MRPEVASIAGRLSLREPQRRSLEILDRVIDLAPPVKSTSLTSVEAALHAIQTEFPHVIDFEREFPSLCFALATGVGKTRLMGAFITYLHVAHGIKNFFVLAPNLTIYNKLIADFTVNTPKYVFTGVAEFASEPPLLVTGETYDQTLLNDRAACTVNVFNISKINSEVRGGHQPRIRSMAEVLGQSYFSYLSALPDLVLIMDESHRYRASAGVKAINELRPILGLELTATPHTEAGGHTTRFNNIIYNYPLGSAIADGFVKEPAVVTRRNFNGAGMAASAIEQMKLEDGVRLHEATKAELETYARANGRPIVKPFLLVIAQETTHAARLVELMESPAFFDGRYKGKVIQVDSSRTGAAEEEMVARLLKVESADEPTEIVVHVNMLKEGWDVTNLYTIVPLRAANARTLIEQSIGRGLRLPYGRRTGVDAVDRLSIVAHDRFQEIVNEARMPGSVIQLKTIELDPEELERRPVAITVPSTFDEAFAPAAEQLPDAPPAPVVFENPRQREVAAIVRQAIESMSARPDLVPSVTYLNQPKIQAAVLRETHHQLQVGQLALAGLEKDEDLEQIVNRVIELQILGTIDIPRILVLPKGEVNSGFHPFDLDLGGLNLQPPDQDLWVQYLQSGRSTVVHAGPGGIDGDTLQQIVVRSIIDFFMDVAYEDSSKVINELADQVVKHFLSYLSEDETRRVLRFHERTIGEFVHAQMQPHYWIKADHGYDVVVKQGFVPLKECNYTVGFGESVRNFKLPVPHLNQIGRYAFGHFERCLYRVQKFQSDPERRLAEILDRDTKRWFRPVQGQFNIQYRVGAQTPNYVPDFVAETQTTTWMIEVKASNQLSAPDVLAKKAAGEEWCRRASAHAKTCGGKPWRYALIAHDAIATNMSLEALAGS